MEYQVLHVAYSKFGHPTEATINYKGLECYLVWNKKSLPSLEWSSFVDDNYIPCSASQLFFKDTTIDCSIDKPMFDRFIKLMEKELLGIDLGN